MRQDEILSLEWPQVDLFRKTVVLYRGTTKNREPKTLPLNKTAYELLKAKAKKRANGENRVFPSATGGKVCKAYLGKVFRKAVNEAEINNFRFHDLRHTFASRLAQQGVDIYLIARLLGHKTLAVTMRYAHHSAESLRKGVELLDTPKVDYNLTTVGREASLGSIKAID
jgi:integrase